MPWQATIRVGLLQVLITARAFICAVSYIERIRGLSPIKPIVWHFTRLEQNDGIGELAEHWISRAREGNRARFRRRIASARAKLRRLHSALQSENRQQARRLHSD
jgi:hypothetical protein